MTAPGTMAMARRWAQTHALRDLNRLVRAQRVLRLGRAFMTWLDFAVRRRCRQRVRRRAREQAAAALRRWEVKEALKVLLHFWRRSRLLQVFRAFSCWDLLDRMARAKYEEWMRARCVPTLASRTCCGVMP